MNNNLYYFIVNPMAASGKGTVVWDNCKNYMDKHNIRYKAYLTSYAGQAMEIAAELTKPSAMDEPKIIVTIGGDGTIGEVITGLDLSSEVTLAPIAAGTGNDYLSGNKLTKRGVRRLKQILNAKQVQLTDYGVISYLEDNMLKTRRFAVSSGMGADAAVCDGLNQSFAKKLLNRLHLGKLSYIAVGLRVILRSKPVSATVNLDGVKVLELEQVRFISSHILPKEGSGFNMAPAADGKDGMFDLCIVCTKSRFKLILVLLRALLWGKHTKMKGVKIVQCKSASFRTSEPVCVHTDGEVLGYLDAFQILCEKNKIRTIL